MVDRGDLTVKQYNKQAIFVYNQVRGRSIPTSLAVKIHRLLVKMQKS
jgi:hypothetical protein